MPGAPGMLSMLSPARLCTSITFSGGTPNFSITSCLLITLFLIGSNICTLSPTSCIKSLSDEIIEISQFILVKNLE